MHLLSVVGARPNFVKIAPLTWEMAKRPEIRHTLVHTGQHYDQSMSDSFFNALDIPHPDINLNIGSGKHGEQTGKIMMAMEPVLEDLRPDWVITVGDVNSTMAASLVAVKLGIRAVHVEAGLRSDDRSMPEEINRLVTDAVSDLLLVTEQSGLDHLRTEGVDERKIRFTGNVMIDSLVKALPKIRKLKAWQDFGLEKGNYLLVTLHRPSNVDNRESLADLIDALITLSHKIPVLFPVHPRTRGRIEEFGLMPSVDDAPGFHLEMPLDYIRFLSLVTGASALATDSGGIQEETTYLGIPCITLRPNTERPSTILLGTNELVEPTGENLTHSVEKVLRNEWKSGTVPPLWDGRAAERIIDEIIKG